jgi:hypothetical protein
MHDLKNGTSDSLIKGYWSGDEYRGKKYITYNIVNGAIFDQITINPSSESGKTLTIITSSNLTLTGLIATDGNFIRRLNAFANPAKRTTTYELDKFPARLQATFSNGQTCDIELYKQANWKIELLNFRLN